MQEYYAIEKYNTHLKKWVATRLRDMLKGDVFFLYDCEGEILLTDGKPYGLLATCDAYLLNGEYVVEYE